MFSPVYCLSLGSPPPEADVSTSSVPTRPEVANRVSELLPLLKKHALWQEENRRLHEESVEALAQAGVFRLRTPARYGGYEADAGTLIDVATELGRGDGSAAWTAAVSWIPAWMVGRFPENVREEIFATPDVRMCGTLSPSGMAAPVPGGVVLNGRWGFITGAWHSQWQEIIAIRPGPGEPTPIMALVPMAQLRIVDDWHTAGLRGSGSVSTVAKDVFVPDERILPLGAVLLPQSASDLNGDSGIHRPPLVPVAAASAVGVATGLAHAARDAFLQRLPGRKITYTGYDSQREAPITHLQVAEAVMSVDEADFHAGRLGSLVDRKVADGSPWTIEERVRARADLGAACHRAKQAVDILATASGASSIYNQVAIQRIQRDIATLTLHALMHPSNNSELHGRVLCGLEPNSPYI
jgi:alkylation response protein AidB-like acyl-CoA dehydrogenase